MQTSDDSNTAHDQVFSTSLEKIADFKFNKDVVRVFDDMVDRSPKRRDPPRVRDDVPVIAVHRPLHSCSMRSSVHATPSSATWCAMRCKALICPKAWVPLSALPV